MIHSSSSNTSPPTLYEGWDDEFQCGHKPFHQILEAYSKLNDLYIVKLLTHFVSPLEVKEAPLYRQAKYCQGLEQGP